MLENKKTDKFRGMGDDRWKTKDKLTQYRGLVTFLAREQEQKLYENANQRRKQVKEVRELRKDVKYFRTLLCDTLFGDKQRLRNSLQRHRRIQLAFQGLMPANVIEHIKQLNHTKLKELDRLHYKKKQKMDVLMQLQLQVADLEDSNEQLNIHPPRYSEQALNVQTQKVNLRYNIAVNVNKRFADMVNTFRQDSLEFETLLHALQADSVAQSYCIIQATRMGQEATEHLGNIQEEFRILEKEVKENMKQRDMAVRTLRREVHDLFRQCMGLVRIESDTDILPKQGLTPEELKLPEDLSALESILSDIQAITHVSTYDDIFPRIKDQLHQRNRLTDQLEQNVATRDRFLNKKNHAELMLATLETTMAETTFYYKEEKARLLKETAMQEDRSENKKVELEENGDLLVMLRCSLQSLHELVARISGESGDFIAEVEEVPLLSTPNSLILETPMLEDAQETLELVAAKMKILISLMPKDPDIKTVELAKGVYQKQVADHVSRVEFSAAPVYDIPLVDLEEAEDAGVPTRVEIKQRSQALVDQFERPAEVEMQLGAKFTQPSAAGKQKRRGKWV